MADLEQLSSHDWELLRLRTDEISLDVVPGQGATIVSCVRRADGCEILWRTPWGLRLRGAKSIPGSSEASMLDDYLGGWQTVFPNGGDTAVVSGVEWGHNGEARITPFDWEFSDGSLRLSARLVRCPFELTKVITVEGSQVRVSETVKNVGAEGVEVMWANEIVLGPPLIGPGAVVDAAATTVHPDPTVTIEANYEDVMPWPRSFGNESMINLRSLPAPGSNETRMAYLSDFVQARVTVTNPALDLAVDLEWDKDAWPYAWYSMESGLRAEFPWYGGAYFLALTPGTSWPAHGFYDAQRISHTTVWLQPDQSRVSQLSLTLRPARTIRSNPALRRP